MKFTQTSVTGGHFKLCFQFTSLAFQYDMFKLNVEQKILTDGFSYIM